MSTNDTPRTNALVRTNLGLWLDGSYVDASFARQLEQELNNVLQINEQITAMCNDERIMREKAERELASAQQALARASHERKEGKG